MTVVDFPGRNESMGVFDVVVFSHLRWDFVFQRPQHLMTRFARDGRVFFVEEAMPADGAAHLEVTQHDGGLQRVVPRVPHGWGEVETAEFVRHELGKLLAKNEVGDYIAWFYTPMMLDWSRDLEPAAVVYDCMDELSAFSNAPPSLREREAELFSISDVVFTGGHTLFDAKQKQHRNVHAFPSSIDTAHFARARESTAELAEQQSIPHPRIGFVGVIDERMDVDLVSKIAEARPLWHFVMIGPVVKIDPATLPRGRNIHYLGQRSYADLPAFLAGWDVAMMPFAMNESTRYISPTKTPEYLAAGLPVVSTPIADVVTPYGDLELVRIASTPEQFVEAIGNAMNEDHPDRRRRADQFLSGSSWQKTYQAMRSEIVKALRSNAAEGPRTKLAGAETHASIAAV